MHSTAMGAYARPMLLRTTAPVGRVVADERVADDRGKVALERGPLVYCAEGAWSHRGGGEMPLWFDRSGKP